MTPTNNTTWTAPTLGAKTHYPFYAGTVVPGAVKQRDLPGGGQVLDVALKVPLAAFGLCWFLERNYACSTWIEMFHEALDRAPLPRRIAALEQDHDFLAGFLHPCLQFEEFDLKLVLLLLIALARHQVLVRVSALAPPGSKFVVRAARQARVCRTEAFYQRSAQCGRVIGRGPLHNRCERIGQCRHVAVAGVLNDVLSGDDLGLAGRLYGLRNDESLNALRRQCPRGVAPVDAARAPGFFLRGRRRFRAFRLGRRA